MTLAEGFLGPDWRLIDALSRLALVLGLASLDRLDSTNEQAIAVGLVTGGSVVAAVVA